MFEMIREGNIESQTQLARPDYDGYPTDHSLRGQSQPIRIGSKGNPALQAYQRPFYQLLPMCLWLSLKQPHILYYIIQSVLEYFKECQPNRYGDIVSSAVLFFLVLICIFFEVHARYRTYLTFTGGQDGEDKGQYRTWNTEEQQWEMTDFTNLKEGQIILVQRYLETNPRLNPTNLLPLAYASSNRYTCTLSDCLPIRTMLIKTTGIDKREQYCKVGLLSTLRELISLDGENPPTLHLNPQLLEMRLDYSFVSDMGETFEAELTGKGIITNEDMIPAGIKISTESFVVGVVIRELRGNKALNLERALLKQNNISRVLSGYLKVTLLVNLVLLLLYYVVSLVIAETTTNIGNGVGEYTYCLVLSFVPFFMNTVYISMHILIYIFRMMGRIVLGRQLKLNHETKSMDELAQIDTLIMDDFFFFLHERPFDPEDFKIAFNGDAPLTDDVELMLKVIEGATALQEHMAGHTIPIAKYFRLNPRLVTRRKGSKVRILKETVVSENCINVKIKVVERDRTERYFTVKFNDGPVFSTISKLPESELKREVEQMQQNWEQNRSLMFFIEIVELSDLTTSSQLFQLYTMLTFTLGYDKKAVAMLKQPKLLERFNVILMTNKTHRYISYFLEKSGMKSEARDSVILLDDREEGRVQESIKNHRRTLKIRQSSGQVGKQCILFLSSTMITYLSRRSIRQSLFKLAAYCKYIVFFNCSQFQKQICAVNLFKIFPQHLVMSNYLCDRAVFQWANLSICERGASSASLTTFVVSKYEHLPGLVMLEAAKSLQIIQAITSAHIFKNMFFLGAALLSFLLVFQGGSVTLMQPYLEQLFYFYNILFTLTPHIYHLVKRPELFPEADPLRYVDHMQMVTLSIKAWVFGVVVSYLGFGLLQGEFVNNLFTLVLVASVVAGNMFVLVVDNSRSKAGMVVVVVIQILVALMLIVVIQLFQTHNFDFIMIGTNFDPVNGWFYLATFLIMPLFVILVLYAFSVGNQIWLILNHRKMMSLKQVVDNPPSSSLDQLNTSERDTQIIVKVYKGAGRTISFKEEVNSGE